MAIIQLLIVQSSSWGLKMISGYSPREKAHFAARIGPGRAGSGGGVCAHGLAACCGRADLRALDFGTRQFFVIINLQ